MNEQDLPDARGRTPLWRALLRGDPIPAEQRDAARERAGNVARLRPLVWMYLAFALSFVTQGFVQQYVIARWFMFGAAVLMLVAAGGFAWLIRRMRRALSELDAADQGA